MKKKPVMSVIMSVYNDEDFIKESVQSILDQDFKDFEFIITDDCSSDGTLKILKEFKDSDSRIKLLRNEKNLGISKSVNRMIELAEGEYIARFDGDDISLKNRLSTSMKYLEDNESIDFLCSSVELIKENGDPICIKWQPKSGKRILDIIHKYNYITQSTIVGKAEIFKKNLYNLEKIDGEDWDLWKRFALKGYRLGFIRDVLVHYRLNPNSMRKMWNTGKDSAYFYANVCFNQKRKLKSLRYWKEILPENRLKFILKFLIPTSIRRVL